MNKGYDPSNPTGNSLEGTPNAPPNSLTDSVSSDPGMEGACACEGAQVQCENCGRPLGATDPKIIEKGMAYCSVDCAHAV